jgi:hypothetical protein
MTISVMCKLLHNLTYINAKRLRGPEVPIVGRYSYSMWVKQAHPADNPADTAHLSSLLQVTGFCAAPGGLGVLHDRDHLGRGIK